MMKKLIMMMVVAVTCMGIAETVTNVRGSQRQDSKLVDIYYDLNATDGGTYTVAVEVEGRTSAVTASTFTGDVGEGVSLGTNRHIVWDAGTDWPDKKGDVRAVVTTTKENPAMSHDMVQLWAGGPYWATKNIGANNPWDYGLYFWWGDTMGHRVTASNCPTYGKSTDQLHSEGWITSNGVLASAHDAAHVQWGGNWRMPTSGELSDLNSKCDWTWKTMNGVDGYVVRGRGAYASNSIFLPAARFDGGISLGNSSAYGCYWSSVLNSDNDRSWYLDFNSDYHDTDYNYRWFGFSVRPVQGVTSGSTTATTTGSSDWFFVDTTDKPLTLTVESADWANGSITLCCDGADSRHTYTLLYYDDSSQVWNIVDSARSKSADANGKAHLTDTGFSSRLGGIPPVRYCVIDDDDTERVSAVCETRNRHGIYVGIDVYEHTSGLNSCVDDANNIRSAFSDYGECRNNHSLLNSDAKKQEILDKIDELTEKVNVGDILLFYFSGHGAQGGYLCCHDSNNRAETNISANELATHLHYFPHGLGLVVMLDACYSTGMILLDRTVPSMMSAQVVPVESTTSGNLAQDFAEQVSQCLDALCQTERLPRLMSTGASSITSASRQGLSSSEIGWITSSQADETSLEVGGKSIFTHEGIYSRGWLKGRADSDKNEVVTFGELGKWGMSWMAKVYARYHRMSSY